MPSTDEEVALAAEEEEGAMAELPARNRAHPSVASLEDAAFAAAPSDRSDHQQQEQRLKEEEEEHHEEEQEREDEQPQHRHQ